MDDNKKDEGQPEKPSSTWAAMTCAEIEVVLLTARQMRAQLRLITTSNFVAFLDLQRQEQLDALLAVQTSSDTLVEILEQIRPT